MTQDEAQETFIDVLESFVDMSSGKFRLQSLLDRQIDDVIPDSLDRIEFIMELEEDFSVILPEEHTDKWITIGDACRVCMAAAKEGAMHE